MSFHVLVGVAHPAWQIKKAAVRHSGRHKAARAPPRQPARVTAHRRHTFPLQEIKHT
ncbi:hypothetical protein [Streptomyces sp. NPDC006668]|uniref:hypothetical protein n=1 Tax=Streptomyces sp. NPDC006668 TaxID=3156903 RepID=UPI0033D8C7F0